MSTTIAVKPPATPGVTVIVLTLNETLHIRRCLDSVAGLAARMVVVDSHSTDDTRDLARAAGAEVFENPFVNQAVQFQWAMDNCGLDTEWILRLDADEVVTPDLAAAIRAATARPGGPDGYELRRLTVFMGRPIRRGFFYPQKIVRLFRRGKGRVEARAMDEQILVDGPVGALRGDLVDENLNDLTWWIAKHNAYASREVADMISAETGQPPPADGAPGGAAGMRRWLKTRVYRRFPAGLRAILYFLWRYVVGLGFLDGREGFYFHFLQALWYRALVDAKLLEAQRRAPPPGG